MDEFTNPIRRMIKAGFLIALPIIAIFVAQWVLRTGRLVISLPDPSKEYTVITVNQSTGKEVSTKNVAGGNLSQRLPAGKYEVRIVANHQASTYLANVSRLLHTTNVNAELLNQADRQKIARNTSDCPVMTADRLFSYTCGWSNNLFQHSQTNATSYSSGTEYKVPGILTAQTYRDGLLAMRYTGSSTVPNLSFINKEGAVVSNLALPDSFTANAGDAEYDLVVDSRQTDGFVVVKKAGDVQFLYYKSYESQPIKTTSEYKGKNLGELVISTDLSGGKMLIVLSESGHALQDDLGGQQKSKQKASIRVYAVGDNVTLATDLSTDGSFNQALVCGDTFLCLLSDDRLRIYSTKDNKLSLLGSINEVDQVTSIGDKSSLIYLQGNNVYRLDLDKLSSRLIFTSDKFSLSGVSFSGGRLLATAQLNGANQATNAAFVVGLEPAATNVFADNLLPYLPGNSEMQDMDYFGKTILATILLRSSTLASDNEHVNYDPNEYNEVTGRIKSQLANDGFAAPEYSINFIVSY